MNINEVIQLALYVILLFTISPLLGKYIARVFMNENHILKPVFEWLEELVYRILGLRNDQEMNWRSYLNSILMFNFFGFILVFLLQLFQAFLPMNTEHLPNVPWHLAFNTAISYVTNTNWQSYSGENTMSYLVQMAGLTVQNFVSAATGISVALALIRGLTRRTTVEIGNFWVDMTRSVLYLLLPLSVILTLILAGQGCVQTFSHYIQANTLQGGIQVIPLGPAASQIAIKELGTNGGGFFGVNSAHPFENPTPFSDFVEMLSIIIIPASLVFTYGHYIGSQRQSWTIFLTMFVLFAAGLILSIISEFGHNAVLNVSGNMEGKETRFGVLNSVLWASASTVTSNGSVNAMIDSFSPLSGLVAMFNLMLGEIIFGGVGSGLYGMIIFIILTVFIAGLMVGRTPEYLGKKIDAFEIKMSIIAILAPGIVIILFSAIACSVSAGLSGLTNRGPHGLSEILYAFSSAAGNNGSSFAGLNANTVFYNLMTGFGMLIGRFGVILPVMAVAGSMAAKKITPVSSGTLKTDTWLFALLLTSVIVIIGGLSFFPSLALGPVAEHLLMKLGTSF